MRGASISNTAESTTRVPRSALFAQLILYAAIAGVLAALPALSTTDLNWCYPYMSPDSWDWLVNALFWSGAPIEASFRPPGLPLVIALLQRSSALPLLPFLNFAMFGLSAALLHRLVRLRHPPLVAALAVLLFVSNGSIFGYVRFVMAEVWTLPLLIGAAIAFARAADRPGRYLLCGLVLALSFLFHYAGAIVGGGLALAVILHRRTALSTRWPWLALLVATPLPLAWLVVRALHDRTSARVHVIEGLVHPSFGNLRYYAVAGAALLGLAVLPLYLAGLVRLLPPRDERLSPWAQAVLYPLFSLALFFAVLYDWTDKRFLYYLFPFAAAVAAVGIAALLRYASSSRQRALAAAAGLGLMLLWNRIPYPASTHSLVALTPRNFLDAAEGIRTAEVRSVSTRWSLDLLTSDGFLDFAPPPRTCAHASEAKAAPDLKRYLDARLRPGEPIAWASATPDPSTYWLETNRLAVALERPVVKPGEARFLLRPLATPDPRALTALGPFELFDLRAAGAPSAAPSLALSR